MGLSTLFAAQLFPGAGLDRLIRRWLTANAALVPFIALQMIWHSLIWVAALWALTFPVSTYLVAVRFYRLRDPGGPHWVDRQVVGRAVAAWVGLLALAFANGAVRETLLVPTVGPTIAHIISTASLSGLIAGVAWLSVGWIRPRIAFDAWGIGVLWVVLTLLFEFGAGRYAFGHSWKELLRDYNVAAGRIWILVLVTTLIAPRLAAHLRRIPRL
jgi:hypothetical protein